MLLKVFINTLIIMRIGIENTDNHDKDCSIFNITKLDLELNREPSLIRMFLKDLRNCLIDI